MIELEENRSAGWSRAAAALLLVLGLLLIAAPVAFGMFSRAPQGATMLADFEPFMTSERLAGFTQDIDTIDAAVVELDDSPTARSSPEYVAFSDQWPAIEQDMSGLMDDVAANLPNYQAVAFGLGLVVAPVAFGMFDRAPRGAEMMTAFTGYWHLTGKFRPSR